MPIMEQTLGTYLKQNREARDISIDEASFLTKIKKHYLEALEDDDHSSLPSRVQGKGFLRLYTAFLELDEKLVINAWEHPKLIMPDIKKTKKEEEKKSLISSIPKQTISDPADSQNNISSEIESEIKEKESLEQYIHFENHQEIEIQDTISPSEPLQESTSVFLEIGKTLRYHRESLHLSLEEIEQYTNIRTHYLKALENGKLEFLPSPVQGRGMLSNYAKFLNLNNEQILLKFAEGLQLRRTEQIKPDQNKSKTKRDNTPSSQATILSKKYLSLDFILTIILIIGIFGIVIFAAAQITSPEQATDTLENPPSISDVLLEETDLPFEPTVTATGITAGLLNLPLTDDTEDTGEATELPEGNLPLQLYVIAKQRAFLRITADEIVVFDGRLTPGNAYEFSSENQIELLTGNAAGIDIYFNQEPLGTLGGDSEVVALLFTLDQGFITPTPRFSPTPTNTIVPSATVTTTPTPTPTIAVPTPTVTPFIP